jgi:polyisoprenoid-binding protein YceI
LLLLEKSTLVLEGDSTLHAFTSKTSTFKFASTLVSNTPSSLATWEKIAAQKALRSFTLRIPVTSLQSETSGLDENLYKELKADTHPEITFTMQSYEFSPAQAGNSSLSVAGELAIAGTTKQVKITANTSTAEDVLQMKGKTELKMSDFNISPPTMMLGMVKVEDKVTINFDMYLALR